MKTYQEMTPCGTRLGRNIRRPVCRTHQEQKALGLELNMARGKPGREQLDRRHGDVQHPLTASGRLHDQPTTH
ncbi:MAG: hypothetical protein ACLU38_05465 [Dysosmobacter sp.]